MDMGGYQVPYGYNNMGGQAMYNQQMNMNYMGGWNNRERDMRGERRDGRGYDEGRGRDRERDRSYDGGRDRHYRRY